MTDADRSVLLAAGGTGGHLFPAYALAEELARRRIAVDLVTDMRGDRYGSGFPARRIYQVPSATLGARSPIAAARTALTLARGIRAAWRLLRKLRPAAIVGFGGYPTFPPLIAARMLGMPTALHEQNAVLGRANRMLSKRVTAIATSFPDTKHLDATLCSKVRVTGNPVRDVVIEAAGLPYAAPERGGEMRLLVFGGSQGARFFSDTMPAAVDLLTADLKARLVVTQQAREEDVPRVRTAYRSAGVDAEVAPFFIDLPHRMAKSHLVIARAGASTVAELTVIGRPAILVPLPHALDNDQLENATNLARSGGGWCIEQREFSPARAAGEIERLASGGTELARAAHAAGALGRGGAVSELANLVEELMGKRQGEEAGQDQAAAGSMQRQGQDH